MEDTVVPAFGSLTLPCYVPACLHLPYSARHAPAPTSLPHPSPTCHAYPTLHLRPCTTHTPSRPHYTLFLLYPTFTPHLPAFQKACLLLVPSATYTPHLPLPYHQAHHSSTFCRHTYPYLLYHYYHRLRWRGEQAGLRAPGGCSRGSGCDKATAFPTT